MTKTATLTTAFAEAILSSQPLEDEAAVRAARTAIIDWLACALGGAHDRTTLILLKQLSKGTSGNAIVIGQSTKTDSLTAALINAHAGHVLDYDDVHSSVRGHPTTVIIPALLALASEHQLSANQLIAGYIVGLEAMARLGLALGAKHYENGFHATATLGTVGVAAAVAHVLSYSKQETAIALGLAATHSSGLRLQFGHDAKPYHAGMAARSGLLSAKLAKAGIGGADDFLDSPIGFFSAFAFGQEKPKAVVDGWGVPWQIVSPGLTLKAFPCCTASHPVAMVGLQLYQEGLKAQDIDSVTITFPHGGDAALVTTTNPTNGIDARFSAEYVFATALIDGALRIDHFAEVPVREDLMAVARLVSRRHDDTAPRMSSDPTTRFVVVDVLLKDGTTASRAFKGLPGVTDPTDKFRDATGNDPRLSVIPDLVRSMHSVADLNGLVDVLGHSLK
ncbi:MmgE/PrpD family protein [Agrobacterium rubi]|uniref:MmgE/PrpD family protein n=1 Tax=Agrobacterium rubi TaxID=28099 RepID=UPI001574A8E0|nr:MmgE/PrpD family protein [Agrobacterium rubi]NTF10323.1 MmgE/PrpD family protein [Agrobacterium rubi]NTF21499.1 MmgE/PrpD family protein [Agrobacterium rubi]NTF28356.1 MmgE/PrpD family protein [Agrobacterium rubi]